MKALTSTYSKDAIGSEVPVSRAPEFIWLLSQCSRILERISVSITNSGLRFSGNDEHGLLSVSARISHISAPTTLATKGYKLSFESRQLLGATRLLHGATDLRLRFLEHGIDFMGAKGGDITYRASGFEAEPNLPIKQGYSHSKVPIDAILTLCKAGSIYTDEVRLKIKGALLQLYGPESAQDPIVSIRVHDFPSNGSSEVVLPGSYLGRIAETIRKSKTEFVTVSFDNAGPLVFTFKFSDIAQVTISLGRIKKSHSDLEIKKYPPDFETCPIAELIIFAGIKASGIDLPVLRSAGLDTTSASNLRQAQALDLAAVNEGLVHLTRTGKIFLRLLRNDTPKAKEFLHELTLNRVPAYALITRRLNQSSASLEELTGDIQDASIHSEPVTPEYVSSLMGILTWCGRATRKLGLLYSSVPPSTKTLVA